jgi:hypothetical protein
MFTNTAFSPQNTSLLSSCLPQWYMFKSSQPTETYPPCLQTQLFLPQTLLSCHLVFHSGICLNPLSQLKPIRNVYKHSFFSPTTSLLSSCLPQWYMFKSSQPSETYPPCLQTQLFLPNHFPPVILSSTVIYA